MLQSWFASADGNPIKKPHAFFEKLKKFFLIHKGGLIQFCDAFWKNKVGIMAESTSKITTDRKHDAGGFSWVIEEGEWVKS